jgi:hypothetical protein
MLWLSALLLSAVSVQAGGEVEFVYDGYGYAGCQGNDYGMQLQALEMECGDDGICGFGEEAVVYGNCKIPQANVIIYNEVRHQNPPANMSFYPR